MKKKLLLTTLFSATAIGCGAPQKVDLNQIKEKQVYCDYKGETYGDYKECKLGLEDSMVRVGQASAKYKMVFLQGGPQRTGTTNWREAETKQETNKNNWLAANNVEFIYVRQSPWPKMAQFSKSLADFDVDDAKKELQETLKRTNDIVKHFKSKDNKVLLIGGSYGGFIMGEYLKQYGTKDPDHIIQAVGRVDIKDLLKGEDFIKLVGNEIKFRAYDENGGSNWETRWKIDDPKQLKHVVDFELKFVNTTMKAIEYNYSEVLKNMDLSKVSFYNTKGDHHAGFLTDKVKKVIAASKGKVVEFTKDHVLKQMKIWEEKMGKKWKNSMGDTWKSAAHQIPFLTKEDTIKYLLEPMGWDKSKDYNSSVDFYKKS